MSDVSGEAGPSPAGESGEAGESAAGESAGGRVRYRMAEVADADALGELHTRSWQTAYRGLIDPVALDALDPVERADQFRSMLDPERRRTRQVVWVVAERGDTLVGHVGVQVVPENGEAWMHMLYLHPDAWGRGIGHELHAMGLRGLKRLGATNAKLKVLEGNERAIGFYQRHGWRLTGNRADDEIFGVAVADLEMRIDLSIDVLSQNREYWTGQAVEYAERQTWNDIVDWGIFGITDEAAGNIFPDVAGLDVVEIGCGTGYVSYWTLLHGARSAIGLDYTPAQLATAAERAASKQVTLPLVQADGHRLPFADDSFDLAINEYGAAIWCDPRVWIPEAARVLRPGGRIWFLGNSVQFMLCAPEFEAQIAESRMLRPQNGMHRFEWLDTDNVEYHVSHGEMISILTGAGFVIEALHELYAAPDTPAGDYGLADGEWASQWPIEEVWVARLPVRNGA